MRGAPGWNSRRGSGRAVGLSGQFASRTKLKSLEKGSKATLVWIEAGAAQRGFVAMGAGLPDTALPVSVQIRAPSVGMCPLHAPPSLTPEASLVTPSPGRLLRPRLASPLSPGLAALSRQLWV